MIRFIFPPFYGHLSFHQTWFWQKEISKKNISKINFENIHEWISEEERCCLINIEAFTMSVTWLFLHGKELWKTRDVVELCLQKLLFCIHVFDFKCFYVNRVLCILYFFLHSLVCLSLLISCVTVQSVMSNCPRVLFCIERAKAVSYGESDKVQDHKNFPP